MPDEIKTEFTECPNCHMHVDSACCDQDEVTGKCEGRCNAYGVHIEDQVPVSIRVDAMQVAKWLRLVRTPLSSRNWWMKREADKAGIGAVIDCLRQLESADAS